MTDLTVQAPNEASPVAMASVAMMMDPIKLNALVEFSKMMASATLTVPKHLQNKASDCLAICMQATQWGMNPFPVAQKTHLVNGNLGYEAQLVVAVLKNSGAVRGRPHYEYRGDGEDMECRAGFVPAGETDVVWTEWLRMRSVTTRNSPLWKVNPKQQMGYVQARNWARLYAPEALLGVYADDELIDADMPLPTGTRHMGQADEVRPTTVDALPLYDAAKFDHNLPGWSKKITSGEKTAEQLITWLQSKNRLTDDQVKRLRAVTVAEVVDATTGEITGNQGADEADAHPLELAMNKATTRDQLDLLADRIESEAESPDWVTYLQSVYHANVDRLDR